MPETTPPWHGHPAILQRSQWGGRAQQNERPKRPESRPHGVQEETINQRSSSDRSIDQPTAQAREGRGRFSESRLKTQTNPRTRSRPRRAERNRKRRVIPWYGSRDRSESGPLRSTRKERERAAKVGRRRNAGTEDRSGSFWNGPGTTPKRILASVETETQDQCVGAKLNRRVYNDTPLWLSQDTDTSLKIKNRQERIVCGLSSGIEAWLDLGTWGNYRGTIQNDRPLHRDAPWATITGSVSDRSRTARTISEGPAR